MSTSWGWHCQDDHQEEGWVFQSYNDANLVALPDVYRCWAEFSNRVDILVEPTLFFERNEGLWRAFLDDHWNHRLLIMNEYRDKWTREPLGFNPDRDQRVACGCEDLPRSTLHVHV